MTNEMTVRPLTAHEEMVFRFMDRREYTRGHVRALADNARNLLDCAEEAKLCQPLARNLPALEEEREEIIRRAVERFEDWASD